MQKLCCFLLGVTRKGKQRGCLGFALISWEKHPTPTSTTFFQAFLMHFEYLTPAYLKLPNEIVSFFPHSPSGRNGQKKMLHRWFCFAQEFFCLICKLDQPERTEFPFLCNLHFSFDFWMLWSVIERADGFIKNPKKARENHMSLIAKEKNSIA